MEKKHLTIKDYKNRLKLFYRMVLEEGITVPFNISGPIQLWVVDEIGRNRLLVAAHRLYKRGILIRESKGYYKYNPDYIEKSEKRQ